MNLPERDRVASLGLLETLDAVSHPEDMNLPDLDFHALKGDMSTQYMVHVNGPGCLTFEIDDGDA